MKQHHIKSNSRGFFEGWYFKHQKGDHMTAFIPGVNFSRSGEASAFLQVITEKGAYNIPYRYDLFSADDDLLEIRLGDSVFSETGICVDVSTDELRISGEIKYGPLLPPRGDIMGPFAVLPALQCNHGVISLCHTLAGDLTVNGEKINFTGGRGYLEKDWGKSFPEGYTWFQSNDFTGDAPVSVMAAVADVPLAGTSFRGVIASVYVEGEEHRLATYNGGRVLRCTDDEIAIKRGRDLLTVRVKEGWGKPLHAPVMGEMSRIIKERPACQAQVTFQHGDHVVFDGATRHASFESAWTS